MRTFTLLAAAALIALPGLASAQDSARLRGTVAEVAGDVVTMRDASGAETAVTMAEGYMLLVYEPIAVTDLRIGDFLSIPAVPGPDGATVALSINVFPEEMRGIGEGRSAWDAGEGSSMVNATIGTVAETAEGEAITVTYEDEAQVVVVPDGTPITRIVPTPERRLAPGDGAVVSVRMTDGGVAGSFAAIMADGTMPRM